MKRIENIWHWIAGLSINIVCDILIMLVGIFSKQTRKTYIEKFYPQLLNKESESE